MLLITSALGGDAVYISYGKRWPYTAKPLRIQYSTRGLTSLHKSKTQKQPHVPPTISSAVESCKQAIEGLATA